MNQVTKSVAEHDDPNSPTHARDVAQKAIRDQTIWEPRPAPKRQRLEVEKFIYPTKGFCFQFHEVGGARKVDGPAYTKHVVALSRELTKFRRIRQRNGKKTTDYNHHRGGGVVSMMQSVAPWMVPSVSRIGQSEREDLFLRIAEACRARALELDAGEMEGGGVHLDVPSHPHFHFHFRRTRRNGFSFGKKNFYFSRWNAPTLRVAEKFPDLLAPHKKQLLDDNFGKVFSKGVTLEQFIDVQMNRCVDQTIEAWIKERGLAAWKKYEGDCEIYRRKKQEAEKKERSKNFTREDLDHFTAFLRDGKWKLSRFAIRRVIRLLPRQLQPAARVAMIALKSPSKLEPKKTLEALESIARTPAHDQLRLMRIVARGLPSL